MTTSYWPALDKDDITASTLSPVVDDEHDCDIVRHLAQQHLSSHAIDYLVDTISDAVDYGLGRPSSSSAAAAQRYVRAQRQQDRIDFTAFVSKILRRAEVTMPVLLGTLVYVDRAKQHLRIAIEEWAHHRVFLGALIVASKYLNDSSLKNAHWAICTGLFGKRDIARIEREFLEVLDFELAVHATDILRHENGLARAGAIKASAPDATLSSSRGRKPAREYPSSLTDDHRQSAIDLARATFASPASCPVSPASATSTAYSSSISSSAASSTSDLSARSNFTSSRAGSTSPSSSSEDEPYTPPPPHHRPSHHHHAQRPSSSANLFFPLPNPHPKPIQLYAAPIPSRTASYPHVQYKNTAAAQVLQHSSSTGAAAAAASLYPSCVISGSGSAASSRAASPMFVDYGYAVPAVA